MENNTDRDLFESFLKESADGFLMVPSRKVWYGIYNNMHPDRKWPSMAVCLLILSAVMYIGVSNNNSISLAARKANGKNISTTKNTVAADDVQKTGIAGLPHHHTGSVVPQAVDAHDLNTEDGYVAGEIAAGNIATAIRGITGQNNFVSTDYQSGNMQPGSPANMIYSNTAGSVNAHNPTSSSDNNDPADINMMNFPDMMISSALHTTGVNADIVSEAAKKDKQDKANKEAALKLIAVNNRSWVEDYAFRNKPLMNKFRDRAGISYYVTPSVGYRTLSAKAGYTNINDQLKDSRALNLEAGVAVQYRLADNIRLKGGLQVNYTNYTSSVTDLGHTLVTTLSLTRNTDLSRASKYSIAPGASTLNRSTVQLSVPVGADMKIAGNNKIKWYVGSTVQPTYVISGSSYTLSQDSKFYIADKSVLRRANLNVSAESFVSFRPSPAVTLSVGPQVRYQLMSTYKPDYNYSEKLYNFGVRVGISTRF